MKKDNIIKIKEEVKIEQDNEIIFLEKGDKIRILQEYFFSNNELANKENFANTVLEFFEGTYSPDILKSQGTITSDFSSWTGIEYDEMYNELKGRLKEKILNLPDDKFPLDESNVYTLLFEAGDIFYSQDMDFYSDLQNHVEAFINFLKNI